MRATLLVGLLLLASRPPVSAAEPAPTKFDNLPADAEVHMVGVYQPLFPDVSQSEITNALGLVNQLREKGGQPAHIRKMLRKVADEVLTDDVAAGRIEDWPQFRVNRFVTHRLSGELGEVIRKKLIYDKDVFADAKLPPAVEELVKLGDKRTVFQTERLNRELLTLVFPNCIAPVPDDFQTAYVTVKPGKPVVLVLSAYHQTRWKVTVEKGATVAGVIQFGSYAQELIGTDAPVIYRASILPNGKKAPVNGCDAYKQDENATGYKRIKAEVKEYTGRDFTSFQGMYDASKEPIVVKPGAK